MRMGAGGTMRERTAARTAGGTATLPSPPGPSSSAALRRSAHEPAGTPRVRAMARA